MPTVSYVCFPPPRAEEAPLNNRRTVWGFKPQCPYVGACYDHGDYCYSSTYRTSSCRLTTVSACDLVVQCAYYVPKFGPIGRAGKRGRTALTTCTLSDLECRSVDLPVCTPPAMELVSSRAKAIIILPAVSLPYSPGSSYLIVSYRIESLELRCPRTPCRLRPRHAAAQKVEP